LATIYIGLATGYTNALTKVRGYRMKEQLNYSNIGRNKNGK